MNEETLDHFHSPKYTQHRQLDSCPDIQTRGDMTAFLRIHGMDKPFLICLKDFNVGGQPLSFLSLHEFRHWWKFDKDRMWKTLQIEWRILSFCEKIFVLNWSSSILDQHYWWRMLTTKYLSKEAQNFWWNSFPFLYIVFISHDEIFQTIIDAASMMPFLNKFAFKNTEVIFIYFQ